MTNELNDGTADDLINLNTQGMDAIINSLYKDLPTSVAANNNLRHSTTTSFYDPTSSSRRKVEAASLPHKVVQPKPRRLTRRRSLESNETSVSVTSKEDKKSFEYRRGSSCDSGIMNLHSMMAASSNHHANNNHRGHQEHRHVSWGRTNVEVIDPEASPDAICKVHEFLGGIPPLPLCNTMKAGNNGTRDTSPQGGIVNLPQEEDEGGNPQEYSPIITKQVTNLSWTDKRCGISGSYTGEVNFDNVPHGMGTFIANVDGSSISCQWDNGSIVVESLKVKEDEEERGREMSRAKLNEHVHEGELSPTPSNPPAVAPTSLPGYHLGHTIKHRSHMIIPSTPEKAVSDANALKPLDFCFIKRSNGQWTYSIVADRPTIEGKEWEGGCIRFVLDGKGSTKTIRRKYWERGIRLVNVDVVDQLLADVERAERETANAEGGGEKIAKRGDGGHEHHPRHPDTKPKISKKKHRQQTQSQDPPLRRRSTIESENPSLRRSVDNHQPRKQNQAPPRRRRSVGSEKSSVRRSRSQPALHQSLTSNGDGSDQAVIVPEEEANPRRKATGELDMSYVSKISDNAVILPDMMQEAVSHKYRPARKSSKSHSGVNTSSSMNNSTSCYAVDAQPQHQEHRALYNQRGTIYKEVSTKKYDGSQQRGGSRHRTSQSCSPAYTKKTIPFTSVCSILKNGSDTEKKVKRRASFQDMTKEDLFSMIVGDENDKRRGSNTSASLGGVSLPSPMKRKGTNEKDKSGVARRSSSASCLSVGWDLTSEEYPLQESILAMLRGNEDASLGSVALSGSRKKKNKSRKKKDKNRASMSSGSSVASNLSSLGGLLREMYTPEYLARAETKLGRSTSSERLN